MKLIKISLKNFRQHLNSDINFTEGLSGIIGSNGSGKSTVVEAIAFCLYGSKALRGKVDEAKTYGLPTNAKTEIHLSYEHAGQVYKVVRDLNNAKIYLGGSADPLVTGNKAVAQKNQEILGLNIDEFLASYYTEQKALEFLSGQKGSTEREKFISKMLGYDKIEKVQALIREDKRDLKNEIVGIESGLGDREQLVQQIKLEQKKSEKLITEEKDAKKTLEKAELSLKIIKDEYEAVKQDEEKFRTLNNALALEEKTSERFEVKLKSLKSEIKTLKQSIKVDQKDLAQKEKELNKNLTELQTKIDKSKKAALVADTKIKEHEKKLKVLKKLKSGADCPTCGQVLGEEFKEVSKKIEKELKQYSKDFEKADQQVESLDKENKQVKSELAEIQKYHKELVALELNQKEFDKISLNQNEVQEKIKQISKKIKELDFKQSEFEALNAKYESARSLVNTARMQRLKAEGDLKETNALLERSEQELLTYDQKTADLNSKKKEQLILTESDQVLTDFRKHLNDSIRPRLSEIASEFLAELSDGRYNNIELADDFSPQVFEDGILKNVISGGEEDLINLCLRLALSSLITERSGHSLSFLILDEVFGSLDEGRRFNVLTLLEKLNNRFEQILVITHLDDIKDAVNNLVYINYDESSGEMTLNDMGYQGQVPNL